MRHGPRDIVRPKTRGEHTFGSSDLGVTVHELIAADARSKQLVTPQSIADIEDKTKSQLVPSLSTLSFGELMELRSWDIKGLAYSLKSGVADALAANVVLPSVLEGLTSCGEAGMPAGPNKTRTQLLADLKGAHLATSSVNANGVECWQLTILGKQHMQVGVELADPRRVFQQRDRPVLEMDVLDLMLTLKAAGWSMKAADLSKDVREVAGSPYLAGKSTRIWYVRPNQESVSKEYLMCLATAHEHRKPVPHFASHATYCALLGLTPRSRQRKFKVMHVDADDWGDSVVEPAEPKRRRAAREPAKPKRRRAARDSAVGGDDAGSGDAGSGDAGSGVDSSDHGTVDSQELESTPESSEVSVSMESSEEETQVSESDVVAPPPKASQPRLPRAVAAGRNMTSSQPWGLCRLTPTASGWQMSCGLPGHEGCTKTRSNMFGGEELVLRMLKHWIVLGVEKRARDKPAHVALWADAVAAPETPSADALDAKRPLG